MKQTVFGYSGGVPLKLRRNRALGQGEDWAETMVPSAGEAVAEGDRLGPRPLYALAIIGGVILAVLVARLGVLEIVDGRHNFALAEEHRLRLEVLRAPRGVIYDRNHQIIARNLANFDVTVMPAELPRKASDRMVLYAKLAPLVGQPASSIAALAEAKGLDYTQPVLVVQSLPRDQALVLDEQVSAFSGFSLDANPIRQYLNPSTLSAMIGYTGRVSEDDLKTDSSYGPTDYIGKSGIEASYEDKLRGTDGHQQIEVDASGRPTKVLASVEPVSGNDLVLTIDEGLQQKLTDAINAVLAKTGTARAAAVAIQPQTGEVLAAVNAPGYDNNLFAHGISSADYARLNNDPNHPLFNRDIAGTYPSGSTIKPFMAAAALQEGIITSDTIINDTGKIQIQNQYNPSIVYTFFGWDHNGLGPLNVINAIKYSSDIFFYTVGGGFGNIRGLGITKMAQYLSKFGFGSKTGIDVGGERAGLVPTPDWKSKVQGESWYDGDTYNVSIGQGNFLTTPLQLAMATAAIGNGGTVYQPHLVKQVNTPEGEVIQTNQAKVLASNFISSANIAVAEAGMRAVLEGGTGDYIQRYISVPVAGKTGTAETGPDPSVNIPDAWFTAYAPADHPTIAIAILIENAGEGATFAAPVARDTLSWYFSPH